MFKLSLSSHTQKFLKKSDKLLYQRLIKKIKELSNDPFPSDSKRIVGRKDKVFRIRVGDYRIEYIVFYEKNEVLIADIDKRERIYHR
jgi:mRNA interferase RelE/StbE